MYADGKWKARSLSSVAHLVVRVNETNDQKPQFERSLYTAHVELMERASEQFVTKLSAKDANSVDAEPLVYSIQSQPWPYDLFAIDARTGVLHLDVARFQLYTQVSVQLSALNLIVAVSDAQFTQTARLSVHVTGAWSTVKRPPRFYSERIFLTLGFVLFCSVNRFSYFCLHFNPTVCLLIKSSGKRRKLNESGQLFDKRSRTNKPRAAGI